MNKYLQYISFLAIYLLALSACKEEDIDYSLPTLVPIDMTVGLESTNSAMTRVITNPVDNKTKAMDPNTKIWMVMESEHKDNNSNKMYALTYGNSGTTTTEKAPVSFTSGNQLYWNDAHSRASKLTIYALAVPGKEEDFNTLGNTKKVWQTDVITPSISFTIGDVNSETPSTGIQTQATFEKQDLCFSNNIANHTSSTDNRMYFDEATKKFTEGNLVFYHALSKLQFKIAKGNAFTDDEFYFESGKNIELKNFYGKGTFDIKKGEFPSPENVNYSSLYCSVAGGATIKDATISAYVIPGTDLNSDEEAISFEINGSKYIVKKSELYNAFDTSKKTSTYFDETSTSSGNFSKLKAGVNYEFTLHIDKTQISKISAQLVDWENVSGSATPSNAIDLTIGMEQSAATQTPVASYLYKSSNTDKNKGYSNTDRVELSATTENQNTGWYWPDNNTYYHFRTIAPYNNLNVYGNDNDNYLTMTGGAIDNSQNDYVWGAPLKEQHSGSTEHKILYNPEKGYEDYLYNAIGVTSSDIHITQFHMMADIEIKLVTTEGNDKVDLSSATVNLSNYHNTANLLVGTGKLNATGSKITNPTTLTSPTTGSTSGYTWRVIPQETKDIKLEITTADKNIYPINDLSKVTDALSTAINRWLPGKKYVYTFTLKKTGIETIKATVVDWETVTSNPGDVVIQ